MTPPQSMGTRDSKRIIISKGVSLALALLLAPSLASAQDDLVRRALINQAAEARDRGDHNRALGLAREAAARRMSPSLRTFIAQEYVALGQRASALDHARTCVHEVEADPSLANREILLSECRALAERLAPAPPPQTAEPPPAPVPAAVSATTPANPPEAVDPPRPWRTVFWVTAGAAALTGASTLAIGLYTNNRYNELATACAPNCRADEIADMETRITIINVGIGLSTVFVASSVVALVLDGTRSEGRATRSSVTAIPAVSVFPGGLVVGIGGSM